MRKGIASIDNIIIAVILVSLVVGIMIFYGVGKGKQAKTTLSDCTIKYPNARCVEVGGCGGQQVAGECPDERPVCCLDATV